MYNEFIKKITANLSKYLNYEGLVEGSEFNLVDKDGNDRTQEAKDFINSSENFNQNNLPEILKLIFTNSIATLQYLAKNPEDGRVDYVVGRAPNFAKAYLYDINFALYYIDKVLGNDITKDQTFITALKELLTSKNINLIPAYMYITGDIDPKLVEQFVTTYSSLEARKENTDLIKDFVIALQQHGKLGEQYKNINVKNLLEGFLTDVKHSQIETSDSKNTKKTEGDNVFGLDFNTVDNKDFIDLFNDLNDYGNGVLTFPDVSEITVDTYLANVENKEELKTLLDKIDLNYYINIANSNDGEKFAKFLKTLKSKFANKKESNLRGKKMFRLSKAYTRYYIKNILAYKVKANNNSEELPQVIKVSTDEIQDLMYGDSIKHPENLSEIQNPEAKKQIFNDVEDAVEKISKGDLLEDGAADGMNIEDIAKKWAPLYNIPYEQMLDVLKTQEQAGSIVEQEHTDNLEIAKEIARDHLTEAPDYYTHLENMESLFPDENVAVKPLMEPENMDLKTVSPQPEDSDHVCDGSCGGNCKCHDKVKTVEDKIQDLSGDGIMVVMVSDSPEVIEEQPLDFIQQIAAKMKE